jgi:hypothetical protein
MLHTMLNRATMRVADTTEVSGRVSADSIKHGLYAKKQVGEVPVKFAQVLVCVAAVGLLSSCATFLFWKELIWPGFCRLATS